MHHLHLLSCPRLYSTSISHLLLRWFTVTAISLNGVPCYLMSKLQMKSRVATISCDTATPVSGEDNLSKVMRRRMQHLEIRLPPFHSSPYRIRELNSNHLRLAASKPCKTQRTYGSILGSKIRNTPSAAFEEEHPMVQSLQDNFLFSLPISNYRYSVRIPIQHS